MSIIFTFLALYVFRDYIAFIFLALPLRLYNSQMRIQETKNIQKGSWGVNEQNHVSPNISFG